MKNEIKNEITETFYDIYRGYTEPIDDIEDINNFISEVLELNKNSQKRRKEPKYEGICKDSVINNLMRVNRAIRTFPDPAIVDKIYQSFRIDLLNEHNNREQRKREAGRCLINNIHEIPSDPFVDEDQKFFYSGDFFQYSAPQRLPSLENIAEIPPIELDPPIHATGRKIENREELKSFVTPRIFTQEQIENFYILNRASYRNFNLFSRVLSLPRGDLLHLFYQLKSTKIGRERLSQEKAAYYKYVGEDRVRRFKMKEKRKTDAAYVPEK